MLKIISHYLVQKKYNDSSKKITRVKSFNTYMQKNIQNNTKIKPITMCIQCRVNICAQNDDKLERKIYTSSLKGKIIHFHFQMKCFLSQKTHCGRFILFYKVSQCLYKSISTNIFALVFFCILLFYIESIQNYC